MNRSSVDDLLSSRDLAFDPTAQTLLVKGRSVTLDGRASLVFQALAERFGQRVSKDQILELAWPGQVVHENSLAKAISRLRRALDGSGLEIAASYGIGYILRDSAAVPEEAEPKPPAAPEARPSVVPARRLSHASWLAIGSVGLLVLTAGGILANRGADPAMAVRTSPPVTSDPPDAVATILWVDDNPSNNRHEVALFKKNRIAVHLAESTEDAFKLLRLNDYRLVVSDLGRGDDRLAGVRMTEEMKRQKIAVPVMIYTLRPGTPERQAAQRRLLSEAGVSDLALTPQEVRSKVLAFVAERDPIIASNQM